MRTTLKTYSIIKALESINPTTFELLCSELIYAGALIPDLKQKPIGLTGSNVAENHTVRSPQDSIIRLEEGLWVFEYSRAKRWKDKFKREAEKWAGQECQQLAGFVFVTTRNIGEERINCGGKLKLTPEEFVQETLSQPRIQVHVFGQNDLVRVLENKDYADIRRKWLNIPEDYFQSIKSFESNHIKQAQDRHIYLEKFVETPPRKQSINVLERFVVNTDVRVLLMHSQGGIGKTRFMLETLKRVKERTKDIDILFNRRKKYIDVDAVITEISEVQESLIVLDDPHLIDNLADFEEILIGRNRTKFILITRSTAKEPVKQQISYPMEELELTPLDRESSIELLKGNLEYPLLDQHLRYLARICEGNPLLIGLTAHLINTGAVQTFGDLKTDDLVRNYCDGILAELRESNQVDREFYEQYLALIFLLKPFDISNAETRLLIRSLMKIEETQEVHLLRGLKQCGILERHGNTLWLYPDLLGEYLVISVFFSDIPLQNFNEIFSNIPSSLTHGVFRTLRELNNAHANRFLKGWARDLSRDVESQDNDELSDNLELLEIIALIVPDETLEIIDYLLKPDSEKPTAKADDDWWSRKPREYYSVLSQCLDILKNPSLRYMNFDDGLEQLLKMYFYKREKQEYSALRDQARDAITNVAAFDLNLWQQGGKYLIQTQIFGKLQEWKQEDVGKYLPLILGVCENLLQTEIRSDYADSEGPSLSFDTVMITDEIICLRQGVIFLLQSIFDEVTGPQQIEVIRVLNCATEFPDMGQYGDGMRTMIRQNAEVIIDFYLRLMAAPKTPELEVLEAMEERIHHLRSWNLGDIKNLDDLISALQSHEHYQLYRTLAGDISLFWQEEGKSYDNIQTEIAERIKTIADEITHESLIEWLGKLNSIADNLTNTFNQDKSRFGQLFFEIGRSKPQMAQALIDKSITEDNALKRFAAESIRGLRKSDYPDVARNYVREWLSGEDQMLLLQVPNTYRRVDEKSLDAGDVEIFETLQNCRMEDEKQRQELDRSIMSNIVWIYKKNPEKMTGIICQLFKRGDECSVVHHINELWLLRELIDLSQWDLKVFEEILQRFVDFPALDRSVVNILAQYGQRAPFELISFFERRVEKKIQTRGSFSVYHPIPNSLKGVAEIYQDHPRYVDVLNRIFGWFRKRDAFYDAAATDLISSISPQLEGPLKQSLIERIKSRDATNIIAVMKILEKFPEDSVSDELCEEAVKQAAGQKDLQDEIASRILYRSRVYRGFDGAVISFQNLRDRFNPWREDENHYVRAFAHRTIPKIESRIDHERERAAEEEIKWQKGLM